MMATRVPARNDSTELEIEHLTGLTRLALLSDNFLRSPIEELNQVEQPTEHYLKLTKNLMDSSNPFLPTLPNRFPDEWYLSYIFRLHLLGGLPTLKASIPWIFGKRVILSHYSPTGLSELISRIPCEFGPTIDDFLDENTVFPYLRPFTFTDSAERFKKGFIYDAPRPSGPYINAGLRNGLSKREPRFCISCIKDDIDVWGMAYFHRSHQIPEVVLCVKHGIPLRTSCIRCGPSEWLPNFMWPAGRCRKCNESFCSQIPTVQVTTNPIADLRLAVLIEQFLEANLPRLDPELLSDTYQSALKRQGLFKKSGVRLRHLAEAMAERYDQRYLDQLGMRSAAGSSPHPTWATNLSLRRSTARPLEHYMLILFLFGSFDNFTAEYRQSSRNVGHQDLALENAIEKYENRESRSMAQLRSDEVVAPQWKIQNEDDQMQYKPSDTELLFSYGYDLKTIAHLTGLTIQEIKQFAINNPSAEKNRLQAKYNKIFEKHKLRLREFFLKSPDGTMAQFVNFRGAFDRWLERNEPEWLKSQFKNRLHFDSPSQDDIATDKLKKLINKELSSEVPKRITISRIVKEGSLSILNKYPREHFPKFWSLANKYLETSHQFLVRKISKTLDDIGNEPLLTPEMLVISIGVRRDNKRFHTALDAAYDVLSDRKKLLRR